MPSEPAETAAILIPSYQPEGKLPPYVRALREAGFRTIVVVDDGSGDAYTPLFDAVAAEGGGAAHVIRYPANRGKGFALRTGMEHIRDACPGCDFVITADSDGQHTAQDVLRVSGELHRVNREAADAPGAGGRREAGLLLGSRDFSQPHVPPKSRAGNRITSVVFCLLYGRWVSDTQTGLRGFSRELLPAMIGVGGDRYEYEMNMLIHCATSRIPIRALPIETVYENNNQGSHFRTVRDSARIYGIIFAGFFRFISSSALSFLLDYGAYRLLNLLLLRGSFPILEKWLHLGVVNLLPRIALATAVARLLSGTVNFLVNKCLVFKHSGDLRKSLPRYLGVFFLIMLLSAVLTSNLHLWFGWSENAVKIPVDIFLFFLSYLLQRKWVFVRERNR